MLYGRICFNSRFEVKKRSRVFSEANPKKFLQRFKFSVVGKGAIFSVHSILN